MTSTPSGKSSDSAPRWTEQERKRFAEQVRPRRKELGILRKDLAEMADVSMRTLGNIERGETIPQADVLRRVMIALDLYGDSFEVFSESTRAWLWTLAPLIEAIPEPPLETVMRGVRATLASAVAPDVDWRALGLAARKRPPSGQ